MKSGTFCFNKAVYRKNLTLYWPLWVCYLLYGLCKIPGRLWMGLAKRTAQDTDVLTIFLPTLSLWVDMYMVAAVALICGMTMFGYLYSVKSANMIHALPVTRNGLYLTNIASGLTCIWGPQILVFLVSVIFCLTHGITSVQYLGMWLFSVMTAGFFFYSLTCFCCMLTGLLFALPVGFLVINYLSVGFFRAVQCILSYLGYGLQYAADRKPFVIYILSPLTYMTENVGFNVRYTDTKNGESIVSTISFTGTSTLLGYVAVAVLLFLLAWFGYRKRKIEQTGDLFTFGWIKPVFRWGMGIGAGYFLSLVLSSFFGETALSQSKPVLLLMVLILGTVGFVVADMLVQKSFRVFQKKSFPEYGAFMLSLGASFALLWGLAYVDEQYIPESNRVDYAFINMNYPVEFAGEDVEKVQKLQREILENKPPFLDRCRKEKREVTLRITYVLKNKTSMIRSYEIPADCEISASLGKQVFSMEAQPDNFMKYLVGLDYAKIKGLRETQIECRNEAGNTVNLWADNKSTEKLYQALRADIQEGNIQKYNLDNYIENEEGTAFQYPYAYLSIYFSHSSSDWKDVFTRYSDLTQEGQGLEDVYERYPDPSGSLYVRFGPECKNILKAMEEEGLIEDASDDIFMKDSAATTG